MKSIVAYLDGLQAKVNALRELQSASGEELLLTPTVPPKAGGTPPPAGGGRRGLGLSALLPSVLDTAFKGEL